MMKLPGILCACGLLAAGCASEPMGRSSHTEATRTTTGSSVATSSTASSASSTLSSHDNQFMREAAQSGLAEMQIGQLAQEKGQSQQVKQMGQMLVRDHQKVHQELMSIASRKGVQLPTEVAAKEKAAIERLSSASGSQFDQLASAENARAHHEAVQKFQMAKQQIQDPELKAFIERTLPVLQSHLDHARQAQSSNTAQGGAESMESSSPQQGAASQGQNPTPEPTPGSPTMDQDQADQQ